MSDDDPVPLRPAAGRAAAVHRHSGQWASCPGVPTHAAVWLVPHSRKRWKVFLCGNHCGEVDSAWLITEDDRSELEYRREQERLALAGKPYRRLGPL